MTDNILSPAPPRPPGIAWIAGAARAQAWMWSEAFCKWAHRPLPSMRYAHRIGEGRRFELRRGSWMAVLVPMVVLSQFVDVLVAQGCIHLFAVGARRAELHAALLLVSLWTVVWAVSLRSALGHIDHVLGARTLTLAIGFKQLCRLPLAAIANVRVVDPKAERSGHGSLDAHRLEPRDVTLLASLDKPTLLIELRPGAPGAWYTRNGAQRPLKRWVAVYVDQPEALRAAIAAGSSSAELPARFE